MNAEEITSTFSYKIADSFRAVNIAQISDSDAQETFRNHDDVIRLDSQDDGPIICSKFFDDYYILANGLVKTNEKTIIILEAKKIPIKFINTLSSKDFVTIVSSFYGEVSEGFVFKETIKDSKDPKKELMSVAFGSMIYDKKYLDFLQKFQ